MRRSYYTITDLRDSLEEINERLAEDSFSVRLRANGRNGYQAVDEYSVYPDGSDRLEWGVRNVCCGSSRECNEAAWKHYYGRHERARREGYVK